MQISRRRFVGVMATAFAYANGVALVQVTGMTVTMRR